ncbi:hypothetical protein AF71_00061640, partial [Rhizobium sp. 57MFTsu3.2]|nr:hypothetical protein [Rhizobium sp. 57MFTsu3.2]
MFGNLKIGALSAANATALALVLGVSFLGASPSYAESKKVLLASTSGMSVASTQSVFNCERASPGKVEAILCQPTATISTEQTDPSTSGTQRVGRGKKNGAILGTNSGGGSDRSASPVGANSVISEGAKSISTTASDHITTPEGRGTETAASTPPADVPATSTPPVDVPATSTPPADVPAASTPPVDVPATSTPPAEDPTASTPPADDPPAADNHKDKDGDKGDHADHGHQNGNGSGDHGNRGHQDGNGSSDHGNRGHQDGNG